MVAQPPVRLSKLKPLLSKHAVFLSSFAHENPNAYYFTGVEDDWFAVLVTQKETVAYGMGPERDRKNKGGKGRSQKKGTYEFADQTIAPREMRKHFWEYLQKHKIKTLGVDESDGVLLQRLQQKKIKPVGLHQKFLEIRTLKDPYEKACIAKAQQLTKACFNAVQPHMVGKSENHVAGLLELEARKRNVRFDAFPPIIAAGAHGATPHHRPGASKIRPSDATVVVDIGVKYQSYCADFTHTEYNGSDKYTKDAIHAVQEAYKAARKLAKVGTKGKVLNDAALAVIKEYGYEKYSHASIGLRLGHHVGLEVHDGAGGLEEQVLKKGMCFTIEPGIYVPGKFGVRFEDIVIL
ncbi:M24 family metallopeptidase [Candidatus Micrarchaeota archaeon]|nr:M24 family metallopeptidase [Candidatus Micrarchaeota archaeon]